jgi:hypothetical protein
MQEREQVYQIFQKIAKCCRPQHSGTFWATTDNQKLDHLSFRLALIKGLIESHRPTVPWPMYGCPSIDPPPKRLTEWHFLKNILASGKRSNRKSNVSCVLDKKSKKSQHVGGQTLKQCSV